MRRVFGGLAALLLAPVVLLAAWLALVFADIWADIWFVAAGKRRLAPNLKPDASAASVVIPNWNGKDLIEKYLPSIVRALEGNPRNEIVVVDNGSTDGSADFVRERFPNVRLLPLEQNLGFGGGSNAGFRAARNDIVVLLNSDMRVEPDFLQPLLAGFDGDDVFAVSCQIFLSDPAKRREETGLTEGWWEDGRLRVSHRHDPAVNRLYPCFYAGGGSSAFDRAKFLELGGFDELLAPFYYEDTDLGYMAWKRGWKVLYQPASIVFHEHRGTIGKKFSPQFIDSILKKNALLFAWKNMHDPLRLANGMVAAWGGALASSFGHDRPMRTTVRSIVIAFRQIAGAIRSRWSSLSLSAVSDSEAFARSRGSHYRDRFGVNPCHEGRLRVLFVSPYPILPPAHGGAVFMLQTVRQLSKLCELHALVLLDHAGQAPDNLRLADYCRSLELAVRPKNASLGSIEPHAVEEFGSRDVRWLIDRLVYLNDIDIVQIDYTPMGQYLDRYRRIGAALFEHDVYFQSVLRTARYFGTPLARWKARLEYLRALRFELNLFQRCDAIQVCTKENRDYVLQFEPSLAPRLRAGLRACIDTKAYTYPGGPREPASLLFLGSSRHEPNLVAVKWFVSQVFPRVVAAFPGVRFYIAGFDEVSYPALAAESQIELLGYVENVMPLLERCAVFICPILSGSGVRVKLLEAFASGIPVVSTYVGAEGLASKDGDLCALADDPAAFADRTIQLLENPRLGVNMAARARTRVEQDWDSEPVTARLEASYRELLARKNNANLPVAEQVEGLS